MLIKKIPERDGSGVFVLRERVFFSSVKKYTQA